MATPNIQNNAQNQSPHIQNMNMQHVPNQTTTHLGGYQGGLATTLPNTSSSGTYTINPNPYGQPSLGDLYKKVQDLEEMLKILLEEKLAMRKLKQ